MQIKIFTVDAFTEKKFKGNPAGVCILPKLMPASWMQNTAAEMNLSETAFLLKTKNGYNLRWFTPKMEVELCGHATLASSHILWEHGYLKKNKIALFSTKSGLLTANYKNSWIELNFPVKRFVRAPVPKGIGEALKVGKITASCRCSRDYLFEVPSEKTILNLNPDFSALAKLPVRGVIITAKSNKYDFISRFFDPAEGINEDPVTGSAHCFLAPFWANKLGKNSFCAYQASQRGGFLKVKLSGNRVLISGKAITVLKGTLII